MSRTLRCLTFFLILVCGILPLTACGAPALRPAAIAAEKPTRRGNGHGHGIDTPLPSFLTAGCYFGQSYAETAPPPTGGRRSSWEKVWFRSTFPLTNAGGVW